MKNDIRKVLLVSFFKGLYFYIPILTLYFLNNGVTLEAIVFSQILYSICSFLGELPTGIFADKFGQKAAMLTGYFLDALGILLMLIWPTTSFLFFALGLRGLAGSFMSGAEESVLYEITKGKNYSKYYAKFLSNEVLGGGTAAIVAGFIIQTYGTASYPFLFISTVASILSAGFITLTLKYSKPTENKDNQHRKPVKEIVTESWQIFKKNDKILFLTIATVLTLNGEYFLQGVNQPLFIERNIAPLFLGVSIGLGSFLNYFCTRNSYLLEKFLSLDKILLLINLLIAILYFVLAWVANPFIFVGGFILIQGLFNSQNPIVSDYINSDTPSNIRSTVLSSISFVKNLAQILVRIGLVIILGYTGIVQTLAINGAYMFTGALISYYLLVKCGCVIKITKHFETAGFLN